MLYMTVLDRGGDDAGTAVRTAEAQDAIRVATAGKLLVFVLAGLVPLLLIPYTCEHAAELSD